MCIMPHCIVAVFGRVLTERREHNAVLKSETSDSEWRKQLWDWLSIRLGVRCCAGRGNLGWREVRDLVELGHRYLGRLAEKTYAWGRTIHQVRLAISTVYNCVVRGYFG